MINYSNKYHTSQDCVNIKQKREQFMSTKKQTDSYQYDTSRKQRMLIIGDCNTLGADRLDGDSYPVRIGRKLGIEVLNHGITMATTREGLNILRDTYDNKFDFLVIEFGLVDSYRTFLYAPHVLYYPDNLLRKQYRSLIKKYKKLCRKFNLNRQLGEKYVVDEKEYENNLTQMVLWAKESQVILIETVPTNDPARNKNIIKYNSILDRITETYPSCAKIDIYDEFKKRFYEFYLDDEIHFNNSGHDFIADKIYDFITNKSNS